MKYLLLILTNLLIIRGLSSQDTITVSIDFGGSNSSFPWNNMESSESGFISNLKNQVGQSSGISIRVTDAFHGTNNNGTSNPDPNLELPVSASGDSFFGNTESFVDRIEETGGITLSGLDPDLIYALEIFASREATDNRETAYTIEGLTTETQYLNASSNIDQVLSLNMQPGEDGTLKLTATTGPNNDNAFGFFYLGTLQLRYEGELQILDSLLQLSDPLGGEYWQSGKSPKIKWISQNINEVLLEYSTDLGNSWVVIDTVSAYTQFYNWEIPDISSEDCLIRITSGHLQDQSPVNFTTANQDTSSCHIVVLGSSTAAGTGPTTRDSAWVWLYEDFIFQSDTRFNVTNLARGGFTTYNILPNGSTIPDNLSFVVDTARNISKALSLNPNAIIINLPSNDASSSIPVSDQLLNYRNILEKVEALEIPYWICTPQPRNGFSMNQQIIQNEMLDSTKTIYAENFIDFWSDLATEDDQINTLYDSGDGVHLNNAGHKILLDRVLDIGIDAFLLNTKAGPSFTLEPTHRHLELYPNPTSDFIEFENINGPYHYEVFSADGQLLQAGYSVNSKIYLENSEIQIVIIRTKEGTYVGQVVRL